MMKVVIWEGGRREEITPKFDLCEVEGADGDKIEVRECK